MLKLKTLKVEPNEDPGSNMKLFHLLYNQDTDSFQEQKLDASLVFMCTIRSYIKVNL